jgi:peptidase M24-like protein
MTPSFGTDFHPRAPRNTGRMITAILFLIALSTLRMYAEVLQDATVGSQSPLSEAVAICIEAQSAALQSIRTGVSELDVDNAIRAIVRKYVSSRGAVALQAVSLASSPRSQPRQLEAGDMVLVRVAVALQGANAEIARTYPVTGRFTALQRDLYKIALDAVDHGAEYARRRKRLQDIENNAAKTLEEGLLRVGLVSKKDGKQYELWRWENSLSFAKPFSGGSAPARPRFELAPDRYRAERLASGAGVIIREGISTWEGDGVRQDAQSVLDPVRSAYDKYKNIRVEIGDVYLLQGAEHVRLSAAVPTTIDEIEGAMRNK